MNLSQRKMAVNEPQLIAEVFSYRLNDGMGVSTVGTLVIAILNQRDWRLLAA
jgi:hypothetical protein